MSVIIFLPWPSRRLHPNASGVHWAEKTKRAKRARHDSAWLAKEAGAGALVGSAGLDVSITFSPPDRRPRDLDGLLSNIKHHLDGIADVAGVDDSRWSLSLHRDEPKKPGSVKIEIARAA